MNPAVLVFHSLDTSFSFFYFFFFFLFFLLLFFFCFFLFFFSFFPFSFFYSLSFPSSFYTALHSPFLLCHFSHYTYSSTFHYYILPTAAHSLSKSNLRAGLCVRVSQTTFAFLSFEASDQATMAYVNLSSNYFQPWKA